MARNYHLTQTGPEVQELLNKIKLATHEEPGLMSAEDKVALDRLSEDALSKAINITYADLVALRAAGELAPGQFYRITDYVTTTADAESRSMGHLFDLVVMAIDGSHLSEEAFAAHHEGDSYFANSALDAWRIWYCLDNDTTRFGWADTANGKGVIYRMVDEFDNDVPYDFKNIQFKRYKVTPKAAYATKLADLDGLYIGLGVSSGGVDRGLNKDTSDYKWFYTFSVVGNDYNTVSDGSLGNSLPCSRNKFEKNLLSLSQILNNIVIMGGGIVATFLVAHGMASAEANRLAYCNVFELCAHDITVMGAIYNGVYALSFCDNILVGLFRQQTVSIGCQFNLLVVWKDSNFSNYGDFFDKNILVAQKFIYNYFDGYTQNNDIFVSADLSYCYVGPQMISNKIDVRNFKNCTLGPTFGQNTITAHDFYGNQLESQFANNVISTSGDFAYNKGLGHQTIGRSTMGSVKSCVFSSICSYITFPDVEGESIANCDIKNIRGAEGAPVVLGNSNFYLDGVGGKRRRIVIEHTTDGAVVATWKGANGQIVGIRSTDNGATWNNYDIVPADVVRYSQQSPTVAQQTQARENLNAQENKILVSSESSLYPDNYTSATAQTVATALGISTSELKDLCRRKYTHIKVGNVLATVSPTSVGSSGNGVIVSYAEEVYIGGQAERYFGFVIHEISNSYDVSWFQTNPILAEQTTNKVTTFQATPDHQHYPSEKLVKDSIDAKYTKPAGGIPSSDLSSGVQTSLGKADTAVQPSDLTPITEVIPSAASAQNQLADKEFVNSSVSTATATFRGSFNLVSDLSLTTSATQSQIATALGTAVATADNNDYAFVQIPTADATPTEIARVERYKYNGSAWAFEYALNNSGFTSAQWAALNSGITSGLVTKLLALPTNSELTTLLNGKQNKVANATEGNLAALDANGQVVDSNLKFVSVAPTGFKRLPWLRSDSRPYINTGLDGTSDLEVEIVFSNTKFAQYGHIFGNYSAETADSYRLLFSTSANTFLVGVNTKASGGSQQLNNLALGEKHTIVVSSSGIVADGVSYSAPTTHGTANTGKIALFSRNISGPALDVGTTIYSFVARRNGVVVLNLIPMLRISDNKPGMYDTLTGNFLTNIGSGEFTYGDPILGYALYDNGIAAYVVTDVDNVTRIAKVAKTNDYQDLDNLPVFTLVKGDGDMALGEDTTFVTSPSAVSFENGTSEAVIKSYPGVKSKMVQTTVPNVTSVGTPSTWNFAMGTGAKSTTLIVSGGNGSAPQLGPAKTVATGELANDGGGSEVMTGLGTPTTANAVTNIGNGTAAAQNITVGTNDKIKVAKFDDLSINAS